MKILHTSDWHLGRYFHNVSLLQDQRFILTKIVEYLKDCDVNVLIIAGDIFDRSVPPVQAVTLLDEFLDQVCNQLAIHTLVIPGNHDSAARLHFGSRHMKNSYLHIMADFKQVDQPITINVNDKSVDFFGLPYADIHTVNSEFKEAFTSVAEVYDFLLQKIIAQRQSSRSSVLISHCFVAGGEVSDSERPLSIGGVDQVAAQPLADFDYVALGHLHRPQKRLQDTIRYSGSPLKYSFSEQTDKKSVTLIELQGDKTFAIKALPLTPLRDVRVLEGKLSVLIEQGASDPCKEDYISVRLTDTQAVLDPVARLREVYPNVLHLEKLQNQSSINDTQSNNILKRKASELFDDFFTQVVGESMTEAQSAQLDKVIQQAKERFGVDS